MAFFIPLFYAQRPAEQCDYNAGKEGSRDQIKEGQKRAGQPQFSDMAGLLPSHCLHIR